MSDDKRANVTLSKTKYKAFSEALNNMFVEKQVISADVKDNILTLLCDIFKFDPNMSSYDRARMDRIKLETGKSTYNRKYYETHKEDLDRKNTEQIRLRRAALKLSKLQIDAQPNTDEC
jgi:hypothetical protein